MHNDSIHAFVRASPVTPGVGILRGLMFAIECTQNAIIKGWCFIEIDQERHAILFRSLRLLYSGLGMLRILTFMTASEGRILKADHMERPSKLGRNLVLVFLQIA